MKLLYIVCRSRYFPWSSVISVVCGVSTVVIKTMTVRIIALIKTPENSERE